MARTVRNAKLDSRSGRTKLEVRREPHWVVISKGCALGYRKTSGNGTWVARYRDDAGKQHYHSLGAADDAMDADGGGLCITYADAQRAADSWFKLAARGFEGQAPRHGAYTVKAALDDYFLDYQRRGGKSHARTKGAIASQISPSLGHIQLAKLSKRKIEAWPAARAFDRQCAAVAAGVRGPRHVRGGCGTWCGSSSGRCPGRAAWRRFRPAQDRHIAVRAAQR